MISTGTLSKLENSNILETLVSFCKKQDVNTLNFINIKTTEPFLMQEVASKIALQQLKNKRDRELR